MSRLQDKVAIVTGAARGIGKAIAKTFANEGAFVFMTDVLQDELFNVAQEINQFEHRAAAIIHDVSQETEWQKVIDFVLERKSSIDVLVNNAGIGGKQNVLKTNLIDWEKIQNVNLLGTFLGIKHVAEVMKQNNKGSIINISSIYGLIGTGEAASYHASKAGVVGLTKTAAIELAPYNIRVNTIHPGIIKTEMTKQKVENDTLSAELRKRTPLPFFGEPIDIAYGALYLASDESRFVTGTELVIDGGYTCL